MGYMQTGAQRIHYTDSGGSGAVLVFSHGLLMDGSMWDAQVAELRARYRCIAWDERGHGRTGTALEDFSYYDSADDLLGLLSGLGVERATLIGMSQGGYVIQRAAEKAPGLVQALVFVSTQAGPEDPEKVAVYDTLIGAWETGGLSDELAQTIAAIVIGPAWEGSAEWIERWRGMDTAGLRTIYRTLVTRDDFKARLAALDAPALVIRGEEDLAISAEAARALADGLPQSTLEVVPGAGHGVNFTHPQAVNAILESFLERSLGAER